MRDDFTSDWTHRLKWLYLLGVVAMLLSPVFYVIAISFNEHGFGARIYEFTFDWYRVVAGDTILLQSLEWTAYLALVTVAGLACGDDDSPTTPPPPTGGTPTGSYELTVTGTWQSLPHSTTATLIVQ